MYLVKIILFLFWWNLYSRTHSEHNSYRYKHSSPSDSFLQHFPVGISIFSVNFHFYTEDDVDDKLFLSIIFRDMSIYRKLSISPKTLFYRIMHSTLNIFAPKSRISLRVRIKLDASILLVDSFLHQFFALFSPKEVFSNPRLSEECWKLQVVLVRFIAHFKAN